MTDNNEVRGDMGAAVEVRLPVPVLAEYEMVAKLAGVSVESVMKVALAQEVRRQQWAAVVLSEESAEGKRDE